MRISKFMPARPGCDPYTMSGAITSFTEQVGGAKYDLFMVGGVFYVVRNGCVGVYTAHGMGVLQGDAGKRLAEKLLKEFPKPVEPSAEQPTT